MINEFVYPLNLPLISSEMIPNIEDIKNKCKSPGPKIFNADVISPLWRNWLGIPWECLVVWYKPNGFRPPVAHMEYEGGDGTLINPWSINFHIDGAGLYEIYSEDDVTKVGPVQNGAGRDCIINNDPIKSYYMPEGAYLTMNYLPHRVTGYNERFCFSFRCSSMWDRPAEEILSIFKDYIIDEPLADKAPNNHGLA